MRRWREERKQKGWMEGMEKRKDRVEGEERQHLDEKGEEDMRVISDSIPSH